MTELNCGTKKPNENLDQNYWDNQWKKQETGWDIGYVSPPIETYFNEVENKEAKILIPGCGNAYEAEFLLQHGFKDITILDIAPKAVETLQEKFKNHSEIKVVCDNFFEHEGNYDFIIEQTFFCAISPLLRKDYAKKAAELLNENGRIVGVLFSKVFDKPGPPFGGTKPEYQFTFKTYFEIEKMEDCYNSIPPRQGNELFINLVKK